MILPEQFFGKTDLKGRPLKSISMVSMDIRKRLSEALMFEVNPEEFHPRPLPVFEEIDGIQRRVYRHFVSGKYFEQLSEQVQKIAPEGIALSLIFYLDETTLNTTRSRTSSPFLMFIANTTGKSFKPILLGYAPLKMPYSDEVLHELLIRQGCMFVQHREWIIDAVKRQAILYFIEGTIRPLYDYENTGVMIKVGRGAAQIQYRAFIHTAGFQNDTKQGDQLLGTCHNSKYCKCRICMEINITRFSTANVEV